MAPSTNQPQQLPVCLRKHDADAKEQSDFDGIETVNIQMFVNLFLRFFASISQAHITATPLDIQVSLPRANMNCVRRTCAHSMVFGYEGTITQHCCDRGQRFANGSVLRRRQ
ncbi:hypothetical protein EGR_11217 [Echinococcus granulosus]|uniref:Uncharacterized protein n=1 Tax=Echinococcus granulosus TaxID=6210 RepID=W6U0E3_ECHGR|nr:hypothetical protein EGR_11217 [Echinococcus granulosus]EUB53926.1 hypothetical protein EGR_11217 [Echinococcus granulosus]